MEHARPLDRHPAFPEPVGFTAPRGTRAALRRHADAQRTSVADVLRRLIADAIGSTPKVGTRQ